MDKEPGKGAQAHPVDHSINEHLTDSDTIPSGKETTVANLNSNANNIAGDVGTLVNNSQNNNQTINYFFTGAMPKDLVRSNHGM